MENFISIGLIVSFFGSLLLAFSVTKNFGGAHQMKDGKKSYLASIDEKKFQWGVKLLTFGIFFQIVPSLVKWFCRFKNFLG